MCIAFDGAYLLEAPTTRPATTHEHPPIPELTTDDADTSTKAAELPVPLGSAIR